MSDAAKVRTTLEMLGFGCPSCAYAIERVAGRFEGVHAVRVDLAAGRITVDFDGRDIVIPKLQDYIRTLGHDTRVVESA